MAGRVACWRVVWAYLLSERWECGVVVAVCKLNGKSIYGGGGAVGGGRKREVKHKIIFSPSNFFLCSIFI